MHKVTLTVGHKVGSVELLTMANICAAAAATLAIDGFTAIPCVGMWRGVPESSTRIEIVVDDDLSAERVISRVPELAAQLNQEAVMVEYEPMADVSFAAALHQAAA